MHGRLACAATLCALLLLFPAVAAAAANDDFTQAKPLFLGVADAAGNLTATTQPGESLTPMNGGSFDACLRNQQGTEYSQATGTLWWYVIGTGRPITVTTSGSTFDTQLGVFRGAVDGQADCQDAKNGPESLTFPSEPGLVYRIQVGGCLVNVPLLCAGASTGTIRVLATSPAPANDLRAAAAALPTGQVAAGDNYAATEEPGEQLLCRSVPYGRTVWYRWTAPSSGAAAFTVTDPNAAIAVSTEAGAPVGCDAASGRAPRVEADVQPGVYLIQVAGVGARSATADAAQSRFGVEATFTDDRDATYPRIASRARLSVAVYSRYWRVRSIGVRNVPAGARVQLRCTGRSCPFTHTRTKKIRRKRSSVSLTTAALRAERILPRTTLEVRVTSPEHIGRAMRFRFTRLRRSPSQQTRCLVPGAKTPRRC
jgi:hypothetical protein